MDIKDFYRPIAHVSRLNIELDSSVKGTLTMKLTDVPWDQALDIVLRNNQLSTRFQANVLRMTKP